MANLYNLKKFDLNLLVIFECIYQHLSISKAADTLFITPSAVSQSLQRLRLQLNDPLFVRSGKGITPTTLGKNLHRHLENNLNNLEQTININSGGELAKRFVIYSPQMFVSPAMRQIIEVFFQIPNNYIEHRDILNSQENAEDLMSYRKADLVFGLSPITSRSIVCEPFKEIDIVLICRQDHPRMRDTPSLERIAREDFTCLMTNDPGVKIIQARNNQLFPERNISFCSDSLIALINIIHQTDLLGFVPRTIFEFLKNPLRLKEIPLPVAPPTLTLYMIYNRVSLNNPGFCSFIEKISQHA